MWPLRKPKPTGLSEEGRKAAEEDGRAAFADYAEAKGKAKKAYDSFLAATAGAEAAGWLQVHRHWSDVAGGIECGVFGWRIRLNRPFAPPVLADLRQRMEAIERGFESARQEVDADGKGAGGGA